VSIDGERRVLVGDGGDVVAIPRDVVLDILGVDALWSGRQAVVRFNPDGASTGAVLKLSHERPEYEIRVNWYNRRRRDRTVTAAGNGRAGFTLLEALVALALVLAFCSRAWSAPVSGAPHHGPGRRPGRGASAAAFAARCPFRPFRPGEGLAGRRNRRTAMAYRRRTGCRRRARRTGPTELAGVSRDGKRGVGLRSGHYGGNNTARQAAAGAMKMQRDQTRAGCDGFTLVEVLAALAIASVIIMASTALMSQRGAFFRPRNPGCDRSGAPDARCRASGWRFQLGPASFREERRTVPPPLPSPANRPAVNGRRASSLSGPAALRRGRATTTSSV